VRVVPRGGKEEGRPGLGRATQMEDGVGGGAGDRQGARPAEVGTGRRRASRGGEGGTRGPCMKVSASRGKRELGRPESNSADF
jgi:hypothetical protein